MHRRHRCEVAQQQSAQVIMICIKTGKTNQGPDSISTSAACSVLSLPAKEESHPAPSLTCTFKVRGWTRKGATRMPSHQPHDHPPQQLCASSSSPPSHPPITQEPHLSMWRSRPCRMTTTLSPGKGKVRGHAASMAYFRNACGTIGMIAVRSAELRYTDTSESAGMQSILARMLKCSRTVPCCPGCAADGVTALCCCPHLSWQQVGSRAHVLLQGRGVQQQVPQVTTGGHRPGGKGDKGRKGEAAIEV